MSDLLLTSCLFTDGAFALWPAPRGPGLRPVFMTNRADIAAEAARQSWEPCLLPMPPAGPDPLALAMQSKWVKFLRPLEDPALAPLGLARHDSVLHVDHKFRLQPRHVAALQATAPEAEIVLRATPRTKTSVWQEIAQAERQERYLRHMPQTRAWVTAALAAGLSAETRIANTGLILYRNPARALWLTGQVFAACTLLQQPECQIFWALLAQPFAAQIALIGWTDPAVADILWKDPILP